MEKEKYERTELEIIQFLTSDAVMLPRAQERETARSRSSTRL